MFFWFCNFRKVLIWKEVSYYSLFESEILICNCFIDIGLERNLAVRTDQDAKFCWGKLTVCSLEYTPGINWFQTNSPNAQGDNRLEVHRQVAAIPSPSLCCRGSAAAKSQPDKLSISPRGKNEEVFFPLCAPGIVSLWQRRASPWAEAAHLDEQKHNWLLWQQMATSVATAGFGSVTTLQPQSSIWW